MFQDMATALTMIWSFQNLLMVSLGLLIGIFFGAMPGLTTAMAIALFSPVTFFMSPIVGISMLLGMYKGGIYAGAIPAILIATPGGAGNAATVADGYMLAKQGKAGKALKLAVYASVVGEVVGNLLLLFVAGALAAVALRFGPPEYVTILLFSFTLIASLSGKSLSKGIFSAALGFLFAMIGIDPQTSSMRFIFGNFNFLGGVAFIPALIGLFAMSEILNLAVEKIKADLSTRIEKGEGNRVTWKEFRSCFRAMGLGAAIGCWIGILPGIGQPVSCWLSYGIAKNMSKNPDEFGKGSLEALAASEAGNNAVNGPAMIPMLTLGIPGDSITAILLGTFIAHGMRPGPLLFETQGPMVYAILLIMLFANIPFFFIAYTLTPLFARMATLSKKFLVPGICALAVVGSYAINNSFFDVQVMVVFGLIGYIMRKNDIPNVPMVIALLLGKMTETAVAQTLTMGRGSFGVILQRPIAFAFVIVTALFLLRIFYKEMMKLKKGAQI